MKKKVFTSLGLMTGTSMDGVDLSIIKSDGYSEFTPILDKYYEFDDDLRKKLTDLRAKIYMSSDLKKYSDELQSVEKKLTLFHANIVTKVLNKYNHNIDLVGFHGQTIFHNSQEKISKQLGDGKLLSQMIKKIVINNFRQNDLENDGQGAPLTPIFHQLISNILSKKNKIRFPINIINIGGISNITQIIENDQTKSLDLKAFDIGPGNCLIDNWVRKNSDKQFDKNGDIAKSGKVDDLIYNQAIDNFSKNLYLQSLDINDFDVSFIKGLSLENGCATLTKFSAYLIAKGIENINDSNNFLTKNLVCGGGRKNIFLIENINKFLSLKKIYLENIDNYELAGDFIESQGFAYLAIRSYLGLPISFPSTTGCKVPTKGGTYIKNF